MEYASGKFVLQWYLKRKADFPDVHHLVRCVLDWLTDPSISAQCTGGSYLAAH